ncbi:MAG: S8 family serine peptidase, partial [Chloroflexi bacterium]|nr:S8 family serine peptidase [Chloroflexota bacterium]
VDVWTTGSGPSLASLERLGIAVERQRAALGRAQYRVPPAALGELAVLPGVRFVLSPTYAVSLTGSLTTSGDDLLGAAAVRANRGFDGSGVRIGVISDGIRGLAAAQASGDAPELVEAQSFVAEGIEAGAEGTALIEIIHDLAPGASISFANAATDLDMIEAVDFLAARSDIVVDDLGFFFADDQMSAVSLNTQAALNNPDWPIRVYITSAGNWALRHYEGDFAVGPDGLDVGLDFAGAVHLFSAEPGTVDVAGDGAQPYNEVYLEAGDSALAVLFWDDPPDASTNDYDLYLLDSAGNVVAESSDGQGNGFDVPRERLLWENDGADGMFRVVVHNFEDLAEARRLELYVFESSKLPGSDLALNFNTAASSILAQSDAGGGVLSVGAVFPTALTTVRAYSSRGPTNNGAAKPDLVAVDGVQVTGSGGFDTTFFGTSAAAPHLAAIAALLLDARPSLTDVDGGNAEQERLLIRKLLSNSAVDADVPGVDFASGAGVVDAVAAVEDALQTILTVDSDADSGPGTLRAAIEALNDASAAGETGGAILFSGSFEIVLEEPLPAIAASGLTLLGSGSSINGLNLPGSASGLVVLADGVAIDDLAVRNFGQAGVAVVGASGVGLTRLVLRANGIGLLIEEGASSVTVGRGGAPGVEAVLNAREGILVRGSGTSGVVVQNSRVGVGAAGGNGGNGGDGIRIGDGASGVVVGATLVDEASLLTAQAVELSHTFSGTATIGGLPAPEGTVIQLLIDGVASAATSLGVIDVDGLPGFVFTLGSGGGVISFEVNAVADGQSFEFEAGALTSVLLAVERAAGVVAMPLPGANTIAFNGGAGIAVEGDATGNTLRGNVIHSNDGLEIDLRSAGDPPTGVTANDPDDSDDGPNGLLNRPRISSISFVDGLATIRGQSGVGTVVDVYAAVAVDVLPGVSADPARAGGAVTFLGSVRSADGTFAIEGLELGRASSLTALATDSRGNTSEFAANFEIGPGPRIAGVTPSQGSREGGSLVTIAGDGFGTSTAVAVFVGGREATVVSGSGSEIRIRAPGGPEGPMPVVVVNPDGRSDVLFDAFRYVGLHLVLLQPGWNNVTWVGPETPVTAALSPLAGFFDRVFGWDDAAQRFEGFVVAAPAFINTLTALRPGQVVWIFLTAPVPLFWEQPLPDS